MNVIDVVTNEKFFPTMMIIFSILAAMSYALHNISDWRRFGYWCASATLIYCVTY